MDARFCALYLSSLCELLMFRPDSGCKSEASVSDLICALALDGGRVISHLAVML